MPVIEIKNLRVEYPSRFAVFRALDDLSLSVERGKILGIVGESGAGKSTVGNAIINLLSPPGRVAAGDVFLNGEKISGLSEKEMVRIRGSKIGFIFQDPMTSLNPVFTIGFQIIESIRANGEGVTAKQAKAKAIGLLQQVGIDQPRHRLKQFPHQLSGGMRQRVVIAIALAGEPELVIADEPTTALDVSIQDQILELITKLCRERQVAVILITHDMGVIAKTTDHVAVMYRGRLVEWGPTHQIITDPKHDYTKSLISAVPRCDVKVDRFPILDYIEEGSEGHKRKIDIKTHWLGQNIHKSCEQKYLLWLQNINLRFLTKPALFAAHRSYVQAAQDVSFGIKPGEVFGLVGESGSGKSTVARMMTGLQKPDSGSIHFMNIDLTKPRQKSQQEFLAQQIQMVFQNPYSSLNPRMRVFDIIAEPIRYHKTLTDEDAIYGVVLDLLDHVGLGSEAARKFPHEFSGGQQQRISIARALASRPRLLICDEPTSALDVSVQAQILNLLKDLRDELGLTMLFISHDLPVVRQICDRVAVMKAGQICEMATANTLFTSPKHEYTQKLLDLMPRFDRVPV